MINPREYLVSLCARELSLKQDETWRMAIQYDLKAAAAKWAELFKDKETPVKEVIIDGKKYRLVEESGVDLSRLSLDNHFGDRVVRYRDSTGRPWDLLKFTKDGKVSTVKSVRDTLGFEVDCDGELEIENE